MAIISEVNTMQLDRLYKYLAANSNSILLAGLFLIDGRLVISGPESVTNIIVEMAGDVTLREALNGRA